MFTAISCINEKKQPKTILDNNVVTPPVLFTIRPDTGFAR